ncbi:hypothetical protein CCUS01_12853 [Colletotrichum cuscutae]|uniref:Uncharacterized protein n=1 Tax=Colletotrichum cuscutae TaxID=1209917 RepID=A0AAI9YDG6_9PEZI|nr:hypothetical protein CCUS01_12853 [Colletotrichum cuscutae]
MEFTVRGPGLGHGLNRKLFRWPLRNLKCLRSTVFCILALEESTTIILSLTDFRQRRMRSAGMRHFLSWSWDEINESVELFSRVTEAIVACCYFESPSGPKFVEARPSQEAQNKRSQNNFSWVVDKQRLRLEIQRQSVTPEECGKMDSFFFFFCFGRGVPSTKQHLSVEERMVINIIRHIMGLFDHTSKRKKEEERPWGPASVGILPVGFRNGPWLAL